ncbi:MAG: protein-disulfide reductase DsbD family protein [Planctomycetota bacterium]|jgi:thiol:disulfide interchange protein DsbD
MKNGLYSLCLIVLIVCVIGSNAAAKTLITKYEDQTSSASVRPVRVNGQAGVAVEFEGTDDLHYYATAEGAPAPHLKLKVSAAADGVGFSPAIFPEHEYFNDAVKGKIEVFVGNFTVFIPLAGEPVLNAAKPKNATVTIEGIACTSELCLSPFTEKISTPINLMFDEWPSIDFKAGDLQETAPVVPDPQPETDTAVAVVDTGLSGILADWNNSSDAETASSKSVLWYFLLAILAGLSINIMPCVLPVIPLIIMRLVGQAKESGPRRVALGFSFCGGIVLFFAAFAVISVVIKLSTGVAIDLNSIYRNPTAVITLFLFIVFFALVLLDILVITLPGSVSGHQSGGGFAGSIGMGFFAGILSTPCSGAIIGAVLVWAQTQHPAVSSTALVLMGVGMALPYALLVSVPKLLDYVPKPGTWMDIFKKTGGFLLLIIAAKFMLAGLTKDHMLNVILYGVVFSFCVWMWGTWVSFSTPKSKKRLVRGVALVIAVTAGLWLLPAPEAPQMDWQQYEPAVVQAALENDQPVLIKFTADWCTNCKIVDKNVYQDPATAAFLAQKGFVAIKADTTQKTYQATVDYNTIFKGAGSVPNTVLLNPDKKTITNIRGIFTPEDLKQKINEQF